MSKTSFEELVDILRPYLEKQVTLMRKPRPGVVACTCNPATLEAEFRNGVGSIPVGGNSSSIGGWIV